MTAIKGKLVVGTVMISCLWIAAQPTPGTVLWTYDVGTTISSAASSPAADAGGTVYVAAGGNIFAVTNSGSAASNKWTFPAVLAGPPAIGFDGTIYFGDASDGVNFYALKPDGSQRWILPLQPEFQYQIKFQSCPTISLDGTIYFVAGGRLYAVSAGGAIKWEHAVDDKSISTPQSPSLGPDGTIYVGSANYRKLYAINRDGTEKWSVSVSAACGESPAIGRDGTVYIAAGPLYAFAPNGTNLWQSSSGSFDGSPSLAEDGTVYVPAYLSHTLYAVSPSGELGWQGPGTSSRVPSTAPAVGAGGTVYYCVSNGIWALSTQGQFQWTVTASGDPGPGGSFAITSPAIGKDGTVYAAFGTKLYAIAGTNGPSNSPWPMYKQNPRHTGKVEKPSLQQPKKRSDANFQFQLYAQLGQTQLIQTSTDLAAWISLTNVAVTNVPMDVVDLSASNFPSRFYRSVSQ